MSGPGYGSGLPQRLLAGSLVLLLAAWALTQAVNLVVGICLPLVILAAVASSAGAAIAWWRSRRGGW